MLVPSTREVPTMCDANVYGKMDTERTFWNTANAILAENAD